MANKAFQQEQRDQHMAPHIAPINQYVATLQDPAQGLWLPEVAPMHAGTDARVISVLRDPGPKTQDGTGSGFLCIENDDPTAERQIELFEQHGISTRWVLPWNAYPWYINRSPRAAEREIGAAVLLKLLDLAPRCRAVLLQGNEAADVWRRALKLKPGFERDRGIEAVVSIHPGRQALWTPDPAERQRRLGKQQAAFKRVGEIVNGISA